MLDSKSISTSGSTLVELKLLDPAVLEGYDNFIGFIPIILLPSKILLDSGIACIDLMCFDALV
ncbi:hypothetical protein [Gudongella sp. DL1XJH-153]|uniref:hypothetical protein n=1 Tax=Gudongella sp. DL1XJH-153 TaxID=3409804 RepID=UPI003BB6CD98